MSKTYTCMQDAFIKNITLPLIIALTGIYLLIALTHSATASPIQELSSKILLQRAISADLAGRPQQARVIYDNIKDREISDIAAVPSAINLVAMGRLSDAQNTFTDISINGRQRDKDYAQLWLLWLTARQWSDTPISLQKELQRRVQSYTWQYPWEQDIAKLYMGEGSPEALLTAIDNWNTLDTIKKDAFTEGLFFAGGYLQYVKHAPQEAAALFNKNRTRLNKTSLEQPLIIQELLALK